MLITLINVLQSTNGIIVVLLGQILLTKKKLYTPIDIKHLFWVTTGFNMVCLFVLAKVIQNKSFSRLSSVKTQLNSTYKLRSGFNPD